MNNTVHGTHGKNAIEVGGFHEEIVLVRLAALKKLLGIFLVQNRARVVHLCQKKKTLNKKNNNNR